MDQERARELLYELRARKVANPYRFFKPTDPQQAVINCNARTKLTLGGNKAGKTITMIHELNLICLGEHPAYKFKPPVLVWLGSDNHQKNRDTFVPILKKLVPKKDWNPLKGPREEFLGNRYSGGALMIAKSYDAKRESYQGPVVHAIGHDEEPPKAIYEESVMRGVTVNGVVLLAMTAVKGMTWVYRDLYLPSLNAEMAKAMDVASFKLSTLDATWIGDDVKARLKARFTDEEYRIRVLGEFVHRQGLVYKEFSEMIHVMEPLGKLPEHVDVYEVMDPGTAHWVMGFFYVDDEGRLTQFDEIHEQGGTTVQRMQIQVQAKRERWKYTPKATLADPHSWAHEASATLSIEEQFRRGKYPIQLEKANNDHDAGVMRFRSYLMFEKDYLGRPGRPYYRVTRNCENTIFEFQNYLFRNSDPTVSDDRTAKRHDHSMDCAKYMVMHLPEPAALALNEPLTEGLTFEKLMQQRAIRKQAGHGLVVGPPKILAPRRRELGF